MEIDSKFFKLPYAERAKAFLDFIPKNLAFFELKPESLTHFDDLDGIFLQVCYSSDELGKIYLFLNHSKLGNMGIFSYNEAEDCDNEPSLIEQFTIENIQKAFLEQMEIINEQLLDN